MTVSSDSCICVWTVPAELAAAMRSRIPKAPTLASAAPLPPPQPQPAAAVTEVDTQQLCSGMVGGKLPGWAKGSTEVEVETEEEAASLPRKPSRWAERVGAGGYMLEGAVGGPVRASGFGQRRKFLPSSTDTTADDAEALGAALAAASALPQQHHRRETMGHAEAEADAEAGKQQEKEPERVFSVQHSVDHAAGVASARQQWRAHVQAAATEEEEEEGYYTADFEEEEDHVVFGSVVGTDTPHTPPVQSRQQARDLPSCCAVRGAAWCWRSLSCVF